MPGAPGRSEDRTRGAARHRRSWTLGAGLLILALAAAGVALPRILESAAVLWDIADGAAGSGGHLLSAEPTVETILIDGRPADIHRTDADGPGLLLLPGLTPAGKDDPRLVDFAKVLSRAGFTVMAPQLSGRAALRAGTDDVPEVLAALDHLSHITGGRPVALAAVSYAVGPAVLAALERPGRVGVLLSLGGYHDLAHMLAWVTTGQRRENGRWIVGTPPALAIWWFVRGNLHLLDDETDKVLLDILAQRRARDPVAPIGDLRPRLGAEGLAVLALLENRDPERVPTLTAALPPRLRAELEALDLSRRDLSPLYGRMLLIHAKDDPIIPWTESAALAGAVGEAELFAVERLGHTGEAAPGPGDAAVLWRAVRALLKERDRLDCPRARWR